MPQIVLDLDNDLTFNGDGELTIAISPDENNLLKLNDDGIYALGLVQTDWNIKDGDKTEGVTIGVESTFHSKTSSGRVALTGIVHRIFLSTGEKLGEKLTGRNSEDVFRTNLDHCLPGDMFRVEYVGDTSTEKTASESDTKDEADKDTDKTSVQKHDYYLILTVDPKKDDNGYQTGNVVTRYVKLGSFHDPNVATAANVDKYTTRLSELTVKQFEKLIEKENSKCTVKEARDIIDIRGQIAPMNPKLVVDEYIQMGTIQKDIPIDYKSAYYYDTDEKQEDVGNNRVVKSFNNELYYMTLEELRTRLIEKGYSSDDIDKLAINQMANKLNELRDADIQKESLETASVTLPDGYTKLTSIVTNRKQGIDLDINTTGMNLYMDMECIINHYSNPEEKTVDKQLLFWMENGDKAFIYYPIYDTGTPIQSRVMIPSKNDSDNGSLSYRPPFSNCVDRRIILTVTCQHTDAVIYDNPKVQKILDWNLYRKNETDTESRISQYGKLFLFSDYAFNCQCDATLYWLKIADASKDTIVAKFVPAKSPDGHIGLYDVIRNKFVYSGSGTELLIGPAKSEETTEGGTTDAADQSSSG